jgi:3D (Asp-Asp-Asp) domain-containing protein
MARGISFAFAWILLFGATAGSAIAVKEFGGAPPLAAVAQADLSLVNDAENESEFSDSSVPIDPSQTRWFNGRPVRPAKTMRMLVTGYSPDERSCPGTADNLTATLHHVRTNAYRLVAADTNVLPFGSMLSIPGYDQSQIVPVLDRGGAIKGHRLDLLFATHEEALQWGRRWITITVWEFADGQPMVNPRTLR